MQHGCTLFASNLTIVNNTSNRLSIRFGSTDSPIIVQNVIAWNKAKLGQIDEEGVVEEAASLHAYKNQSFIQRVKSRFKRVRLN